MTAPVLHVRVDWANAGVFTGACDDVSAYVDGDERPSWTRGRSADNSVDATGSANFTLDNADERFTPDRNWHDNPSFESGTAGWSIAAIASLTAAATSITQVTDNAPNAGSKAGEAVLTGTIYSGVTYPVPYKFRSGVIYAVSVYLKSMSGALTVRAGLASSGTPTDIASSGANITTSWAAYTFTWTPSADRLDAVFFVRTTAAAAATLRIDAVQDNPGATANTYIEAPTKGQLVPGRPVHIYATYSATDYPQFYGYIERLAPDPAARTVAVTCYDVLRRLGETDVVVAAHAFVVRSARDFRREVLEDYERGVRNLVSNPEFGTDTSGWATDTATLTRLTTDGPPVAPGTCAELVATGGSQRARHTIRLAPAFFAGQVYRLSMYLRVTSGSADWKIALYTDAITAISSRTVTVTTAWTRHTLTFTAPATYSSSSANAMVLMVEAIAAGTVLIGAVAVTRGQALFPYAATGTGRWPNWCGNGSFDGGALNGWHNAYTNLCSNGDFETDVAGWTQTADAFHTAGAGAPTRITTHPYYGAASMELSTQAVASSGAHIVLSGTFKSGRTVRVYAQVGYYTVNGSIAVGIGSQGTPGDKAETTLSVNPTTYTTQYSFTWVPSGDRSDVHLYVRQISAVAGTLSVDGVAVFLRSASATSDPIYAHTGPGGGGVPPTTTALSTTAKYGAKSQRIDTPATATAGLVYEFTHLGGYFVSGQPYSLSLWLRPTSDMPYKVGISAALVTGTFDEASTTGTATANVWTQITLTWTPSANRPSLGAFDEVALVYQTDATARTFLIDGVRVIPGSTADDFEMTQWSLAVEGDTYQTSASLGGSALSALIEINGYALTRHWIQPTMAAPWYTYVTASRDAVRSSAETFDDDITDFSAADIDRASIVNVVPVTHSLGTNYYSDEDSVGGPTGKGYGPRPTGAIGNANFLSSATADIIGPALVARFKDVRARPAMTVANRFLSQLQRQLDDLVTVNFARLRIYSGKYLVLRARTTLLDGGTIWNTVYDLEEFP